MMKSVLVLPLFLTGNKRGVIAVYEKDVKKYLADVGRYLVCSEKQKKKILKTVEVSVTDFILENDIIELSEVYERFGTPEDIAKNYLADANPADVRKALNKKKVFIIAAVIALVIFSIGVAIVVIENHKEIGHLETHIIEYVEACIKPIFLRR